MILFVKKQCFLPQLLILLNDVFVLHVQLQVSHLHFCLQNHLFPFSFFLHLCSPSVSVYIIKKKNEIIQVVLMWKFKVREMLTERNDYLLWRVKWRWWCLLEEKEHISCYLLKKVEIMWKWSATIGIKGVYIGIKDGKVIDVRKMNWRWKKRDRCGFVFVCGEEREEQWW